MHCMLICASWERRFPEADRDVVFFTQLGVYTPLWRGKDGLHLPSPEQKGWSSMALLMPRASRANVVLIAYVVLSWFILALSGSILGTFVQKQGNPPLVFGLTVGGMPYRILCNGTLL